MVEKKNKSKERIKKDVDKLSAKVVSVSELENSPSLEQKIIDALFRVAKKTTPIEKFGFKSGDSIRNMSDNKIYVCAEDRTFTKRDDPPKAEIAVYELIPYAYYKRDKTPIPKKGISPQKVISMLVQECNEFLQGEESRRLTKNELNEDYVRKQLKGEKVSSKDRKHRRIINEMNLPTAPLGPIWQKKELIYNLKSILNYCFDGIDSTRMKIHYIARILLSTGIEKGELKEVERNLQARYRDLI